MKESNFSKNESEYLKNKENIEKKYPMNYIYQIRHSISKKVSWIPNDIKMIFNFNAINRPRVIYTTSRKHFHIYENIVIPIIEYRHTLIRKILEIDGIGKWMDVRYPKDNLNVENFIFDTYKENIDLGLETFERVKKRFDKYLKDKDKEE